MSVRFHLDENMPHAVANGLRRRGIDVTTVTETNLIGASDEDQLAFALAEGRVLITRDDDFLRLSSQGVQHAGIVYVRQYRRTIGQIVMALARLHRYHSSEQMHGQVEYL